LCGGGDVGVDGPPLLLFWAASVLLPAAGETNSGCGICIRFCRVPHWLSVLLFFFLFVCLGGVLYFFFFWKGKARRFVAGFFGLFGVIPQNLSNDNGWQGNKRALYFEWWLKELNATQQSGNFQFYSNK
jgi:hypothetical protein